MADPDASEILEVRRALAEERALREALEADLQRSAQIGQELLLKNEELEQVVKEHAEKTAHVARRASVEPVRRACTVPLGPKEATAEEEESDSELPTPQLLRRGRRAGKTVMVEELMSANLSLHDDLMRLKDEQRQAGLNDDVEAREEGIQNVDEEEGNLVNELQHRVSVLESGRKQLQKELGASQEKAARAHQLEEELEATRSSLHLAQSQLTVLEEANRALRTSQQALDTERAKLASLLEAADARCVHLEQELEQTTLARARGSRKSTGSILPMDDEVVRGEADSPSLAVELEQDGHESWEEALRVDCVKVASKLRTEVGDLSRATASCKAWLVAARRLCDEKIQAPALSGERSDDEAST
ncbi:unnamed protein product [Symbiodinium necroappetens]|uniref:Uncharacterized protein n=1 Tax=Symbiodinium necroappetens TaxID=1628268 RepID=A0A813CAY4_9DINO|nr:unnamed protein product [Symbiodinium necroappetens]